MYALRYLSILILSVSAILISYEYYFASYAVAVQGEVVDIDFYYNRANKTSTAHYAVAFAAEDGNDYVATGSSFLSSMGDKVKVYYDPADPTDNLIAGMFEYIVLASIGGIFLILGLVKWKRGD